MLRKHDLPVLQEIAANLAFKKRLRNFSLTGLALGLLCLFLGVFTAGEGQHRLLLFLVGLGFWFCAVGTLRAPGTIKLIVAGIFFIGGGLYGSAALLSIVAPPPGIEHGEPPLYLWGIIIPTMFIWGRLCLIRSAEARRNKRVSDALLLEREVAATIDGLASADPDRSPEIVEFIVLRSMTRQQNWRGRLLGEVAIFIEGRGSQIIIADKDDVDIMVRGDHRLRNSYRINLRCEEREIRHALISSQSLENYLTWKLE